MGYISWALIGMGGYAAVPLFVKLATRTGKRIEVLLLVNALAAFASWLTGLACEAAGLATWLVPIATSRKLYSTLRIGREALLRGWPLERTSRWLERLRCLPASVLDHMQVCT